LTELKKEKEWLKDLNKAFQNNYKESSELPKFKTKKNGYQSYRTAFTNNNIEIEGNKIKLP